MTFVDVYNEIDSLRTAKKIKKWAAKKVKRKYCFESKGIPAETEYLKMVYSFKGN